MERVVTLVQQQTLLTELLRTQRHVATLQEQVASGKVGDQFADIVPQAGVLLAAKRQEARIAGFQDTATEIAQQLDLQDLHLTSVAAQAQELRQGVLEAIANGSGLALMERVEGLFAQVTGLLNTRIDGRYIYGGTRSDVPPVNVSDTAGLLAAPTVADVFENNAVKPAIRVDESEVIEYGLLASDIGAAFFQAVRNIAEFNAGANGPFAATLTPQQAQFLQGEVAGIVAAYEGLSVLTGQNGLRQAQVAEAQERHTATTTVLKAFISDIEDVDLAAAVSRLNDAQLAAQASARVLAEVNQLSLLQFLD